MLRPFALHRPTTLPEVGDLLREHGDDAALYAGGTELLLLMKAGFVRPRMLVDLKRVPELSDVRTPDGAVRIGATVTHRVVERSAAVRARCPLVADVARHVANVRVRTVGTVGGNLAFADPHSDLATVLLLFEARLSLWSAAGERDVPLAEFVLGPYETARRDGEVLTGVHLLPWPAGAAGAYLKFGVHERPTLGVAAVLIADPGSRRVSEARVAIGCIGPRPRRLADLEAQLRGRAIADVAAGDVDIRGAVDGLDAIADLHGSADYKLAMAQVFVGRALGVAAGRAGRRSAAVDYAHTVVV